MYRNRTSKSELMVSTIIKEASEIVVVVPVKDNQDGINRLLKSFFDTTHFKYYPKLIVLVDNASEPPIVIPKAYSEESINIHLISCPDVGLAKARNAGIQYINDLADDSIKWLLFIDSDCLFTESTIRGFIEASQHKDYRGAVGYQGMVKSLGDDWLSKYYEDTACLVPFSIQDDNDIPRPQFLVGACHMIYIPAIKKAGNYDVTYTQSSEDFEFSIRLNQVGKLAFAHATKILHDYLNGAKTPTGQHVLEFISRYKKYAWGKTKIMEQYLDKSFDELTRELELSSKEELKPPLKPFFYLDALRHCAETAGVQEFINMNRPDIEERDTHSTREIPPKIVHKPSFGM